MTREEIVKRIEEVEAQIMYEECADLGYRFNVVKALNTELRKLREALAKLG